jgi:TatD DNase family protein
MTGRGAADPRQSQAVALTDTHCHLYMERFETDLPDVIRRALEAGVQRMLVPGLDAATSRRAMELARDNPAIYCAIGFHPTEIQPMGEAEISQLEEMLPARKVVGIGEVGLDYYWVTDIEQRRLQCAGLQRQLRLALVANLPVVLHLREDQDAEDGPATADLLALLRDWVTELQLQSSPLSGRAGVLHSFSGSPDTATQAINLGFYIGVTGPITYPNADRRRTLIQHLPLERLLIETDSPFLAPQERRGRRNEPAYVTHIADRIANIQSRTPTQVAEITSRNAARLFAWGEPD